MLILTSAIRMCDRGGTYTAVFGLDNALRVCSIIISCGIAKDGIKARKTRISAFFEEIKYLARLLPTLFGSCNQFVVSQRHVANDVRDDIAGFFFSQSYITNDVVCGGTISISVVPNSKRVLSWRLISKTNLSLVEFQPDMCLELLCALRRTSLA